MKTILTICVLLAVIGSASADPQKKSFTATQTRPEGARKPDQTAPPVYDHNPVQGAVPRGFRGGNPLQMLNPKAPARYGTWVQSTSFDPAVPGKWKGIKLFELVF